MKNMLIALCCLISLGVLSLHAESFEGSEKSQAAAQAPRHKPVEQCGLDSAAAHAEPERFVAMNFNAPLHVAGQKPATGNGSIMPAGLSGNPQVVAATSVLPHQPLVLNTEPANGPCCYEEGIQVLVPEESDHYVVSFDLASQQLGRSTSQFQLWLNDGPAPLLRLQSDYLMMLDGVGAIASFHDDQLLHVQLFLNLAAEQMAVAINGETLYQGPFTLDHLHSLQFLMTIEGGATPEQVNPLASVAIDNIVVANAAYRYTNLQARLQRGALTQQQKGQMETVAHVRNVSGHIAQQVKLTHLLPEGVRVVDMQSDSLACETSGGQVRCDADALQPLEQASVTLTLALDDARSPLDISLIATSSTDEIDNYDNQSKARFAGSSTLLGIAFLLLLWMAREWFEER